MSRSVDLWVGKTDDEKVPPRVRLRVFEREGGKCWISGRKIAAGEAWELDHKIALINGGRHSEDNLAPALVEPHREKTGRDVKVKAKIARQKAKHLGVFPASPFKIRSRGFRKRFSEPETQAPGLEDK